MVMEAPPTPQCVGREFVRQYYTLLNKAPTHLHRFYNNQSSFVHGGLDASNRDTNPVIGQKQIHQKIQQLNFRDCHAKITQVDSQATLGNGVVVQVTGELSNAGQPMRRFTQTFVLAAQSPKKYYVHNDIFRYQDEIITEEECDPESSRSEAEDEMPQEHPSLQDGVQQQQTLPQQPIPYYSANNAAATLQTNLPPVIAPHHHGAPPQQHPVLAPQQQVPTVNGAVHPEDLPNVIAAATGPVVPQAHIPAAQTQGMSPHAAALGSLQAPGLVGAASAPLGASPLSQQLEEEPQPMEEPQGIAEVPIEDGYGTGVETQDLEIEPVDVQEIETAIVSNEPKTYATLLKSGGNTGTPNTGYISSVQVTPSPIQISKPMASSPPPPQNRYDQRDTQSSMGGPMSNNIPMSQRNSNGPRGLRNNNTQRGVTRQDSRGPPRNNFNDDDDRRRTGGGGGGSQYGDSHQLFLGNLPHHATEDELREIFGKFGAIMDLRIHSKSTTKGGLPGGRIPPNYGFITYDDPQSVQNCLLAKPLFFPNNSESGQKLNVEEKKTRPRPSMDGGRPDNGGGRPGGGNNGPRAGGNLGSGGMGRGTGTGMGRGGRGGTFSRGGPTNRTGGPGGGQNTTNTYNNRR